MPSGAADPWGANLESFFHGARERRIGAEQERQRLEAEYVDKLLAAHAQGAEQGAAAERARIRQLGLDELARLDRKYDGQAMTGAFRDFIDSLGESR